MEYGTLPGMEGALEPVDEAQRRSEEARRLFEAGQGAAAYLDDYWALLGEGWPWRQAVYMIWASQPREGRWPKTQGELAREALGLGSDRAIREWREKNAAMDARIAKLAASMLAKHRSEIYAALIESASNPDPRSHSDRKLALEMLGDYTPRQTVEVGVADGDRLGEASRESLAALAGYDDGEWRAGNGESGAGDDRDGGDHE